MKSGEAALPTAARFVTLGIIESSTPRPLLLAALRRLRPRFTVRLRTLQPFTSVQHFRLELDVRDVDQDHSIDAWLSVKSALLAAFPAGKPGAVRVLES